MPHAPPRDRHCAHRTGTGFGVDNPTEPGARRTSSDRPRVTACEIPSGFNWQASKLDFGVFLPGLGSGPPETYQ